MVNDTIGDLLARIKNAYQAGRQEVAMPYSRLSQRLLQILVKAGYLSSVMTQPGQESGKFLHDQLVVGLRYIDHRPVLSGAKRVSKPGRRLYVTTARLPRVLDGLGIAIVSTNLGLMTDSEARRQKIGGEVMCLVW